MWTSYLTGLAAVALLSTLWLAVQRAWERAFPGVSSDPDVLAGRPGCGDCGGLGCGVAGRCRRQELEFEADQEIEP